MKRKVSTELTLGLNSSAMESRDISTELTLGPATNSSTTSTAHTSEEQEISSSNSRRQQLLIKVFAEGHPYGRKVDLFDHLHDKYDGLRATLGRIFGINILRHDMCMDRSNWNQDHYVLVCEDKDGDEMLVGDIPWEMFLTSVEKLFIKRADRIH